MPSPSEIISPQFLKDSIIDYLKNNYEQYKNIDFNSQDSQSLLLDISSYITVLISNRFEQQISDFYILTQSNDRINLQLSQYGYKKSFGVPSQVNLYLSFDERTMQQFNYLELENFIIPPLVLKVLDKNGSVWLNKNSILVSRTVEKFGKYNNMYKYRLSSFNGNSTFSFVQMELTIQQINISTKQLSRNKIISQLDGFIVQDHFITDFNKIKLNMLLLKKEEISYIYNNINILENKYNIFENINEIQQSKFHVENYDNYILNKYITFSYNEVSNQFEIINGDNISNGYQIESTDGVLYLQYYKTKGSAQNQILGQVNTFGGIQNIVMLNDMIYQNYVDYNNYTDLNIKGLFTPQKIKIKYNIQSGKQLSEEEQQNIKTDVFLYDMFNSQNVEQLRVYGYQPINIIVTQQDNVIIGKDQEKIQDVKFNYNYYSRQKNKIVTVNDIDNYLTYFLNGYSYSLNQQQTYKHIFSKTYVNGLENRLYILPQVFKDDNFKNLYLVSGVKLLSSEITTDPIINRQFNYTKEKFNIIQELENTIVQTMDVQFQSSEKIHIYSKNPIEIIQNNKVSINSMFYSIKNKLEQYQNIKNKNIDIFNGINLIDIMSVLLETPGVINVDMDKFLNSFGQIIETNIESNNIVPLQYQIIKDSEVPIKVKTQYIVPISTSLEDESFISNSLNLFLFDNIIGEVYNTGINEIFQDYTNYDNYMLQSPVQLKLNNISQFNYTILPVYTVKDTMLPIPQILDNQFTHIILQKKPLSGAIKTTQQQIISKYEQLLKSNSTIKSFSETIKTLDVTIQVSNTFVS